jgi:hypothetical protein
MSRKGKSGLVYFPVDVDIFNDEKIELVSARLGVLSELICIKILTRIYRQGYYIYFNEDISFLFAKKFGDGINQELVNSTVQELIAHRFFSKKLFDKFSILTSRGIQQRYLEATKRRKKVEINEGFLLISKSNVNILNKNVTILPLNVNIKKQSKVKESKVKESKVNIDKKLLSYLNEQIELKSLQKHQKKMIEFFSYRMKKNNKDRYVTEYGIDGLIRHVNGCIDNNLDPDECMDIAMQRNWKTPDPSYFNQLNFKNRNRDDFKGGNYEATDPNEIKWLDNQRMHSPR